MLSSVWEGMLGMCANTPSLPSLVLVSEGHLQFRGRIIVQPYSVLPVAIQWTSNGVELQVVGCRDDGGTPALWCVLAQGKEPSDLTFWKPCPWRSSFGARLSSSKNLTSGR